MKKILFAMLLLCLSAVSMAHAGEEEEIITVMTVGMGADSDGALKNALRNAVTQAVGSIIDSETMVQNDEVIQDKILSHSGGFVEEYDIVGQPRAENGLVSVTINAKVKRMNLKKEMESNNIFQIKKIDGKVFTKQIQLEDSAAMFKNLLDGFPEQYVDIKIEGEPYLDDKNEKFIVKIRETLDVEKTNQLIKDLIAFLDAALPTPAAVVRSVVESSDNEMEYNLRREGDRQFFLPVFINSQKTMATWKVYTIDNDLAKVVDMVFYNPPMLTVDVTIDGDISIIRETYRPLKPFRCSGASEQKNSVVIAPVLSDQSITSTNWIGEFNFGKTSGTYTYNYDLNAEEVKLIKDVKLSVARGE
jgi:hypothetical protein